MTSATTSVSAVPIPRVCKKYTRSERRVYAVLGTYWNALYPDCLKIIQDVNERVYTVLGTYWIICKVMESIIRDHIMDFFFQNNYLSKNQFGFIKGRSNALQFTHHHDKLPAIFSNYFTKNYMVHSYNTY